ncbi:MAG: hypothetical protein QG661_2768 [Actinomycetota bacterium]|nr:hypothetical protein [Actinomycetota bacterium]
MAIVTRNLGPLALVAVGIEGDARVSIVSGGTDFTAPTIWQRRGFGDICWKLVGFNDATTYTLPAAVVPFAAPRATWRYSAVIVSTQRGPVVYRYPSPAEFVSGNGLSIQSAVVCVKAVPNEADLRARPLATSTPAASATASAAPVPITPTIRPSGSATASPSGSASASATTTPSPSTPSPSSTAPTAAPAPEADSDKKIALCHATSSQSNPYSVVTVSTSAALNGHGGHTGPLYPQVGWGDVIPPFDDYPGMNWPAGAGLVADGCVVAPAPTPTPTPTPTDPGVVDPIPILPERPVVPRPPIIGVLPPYRPSPPIATLSPSPSGTASPPIATLSPSPSGTATAPVATISPRPTVRPSRPVATIYPSPSGTAIAPVATISPRPSASPSTPIATITPTPSGTAGTPIATSTPSTGGSGGGATPTEATPAVPDGGSGTPDASDAGTSSIEPSVPACDSVTDGKVRLFLTNGVSAIEVTRAYDKLVCVAGARVGPGTDDVDQVVDDSTGSDPSLASTGSGTRTLLTASLILVGLGLLFVPGLARRR